MTDNPKGAVDPAVAQALDWVLKLNEDPGHAQRAAELKEWLAASDSNAEAYRKALRVWKITGDVSPAHSAQWADRAPSGYRRHASPEPMKPTRGSGTIGARRRPGRRSWSRSVVAVACVAAAALVLVPEIHLLIRSDYRTNVAQVRSVALPDGTSLTLGGNSAVAVDYGASKRRIVLLKGEAFFDVAHQDGRPFVVEAGAMTVRDIGTAFDVAMEPANLEVSVQTGEVGVTYGLAPVESLTAGEALAIDRETWQSTRTRKALDAIGSWRTKKLVVDNLAVDEVVQRLRRYFDGFIWIKNQELGDRKISGVFDLADPLSALKAVVEPHAGVVTEVTPFLLIVGKR